MAALSLRAVSRRYGEVAALDGISLEIDEGEFFALLGPSGSGKTTCLRLIAGFEQPSSGELRIHDRPMLGVPPYQRDVNTVFQDYALFPHLNVLDNVAYGPMVRGVDRASRHRQAGEMLELVKLADLGTRRPAQLSGGQRQRVALARALINHPRVLLLDEPLGALDLKLREQMQEELKALQRRLGITFVFVTHDQDEALSMSDRLAVFKHGRIEQVGTPLEVYEHPSTAFVAGFVGVSNILPVEQARQFVPDSPGPLAIRPENLLLTNPAHPGEGDGSLIAMVYDLQYHGASTRYRVKLEDGTELLVSGANRRPLQAHQVGDLVRVCWHRDSWQALAP